MNSLKKLRMKLKIINQSLTKKMNKIKLWIRTMTTNKNNNKNKEENKTLQMFKILIQTMHNSKITINQLIKMKKLIKK